MAKKKQPKTLKIEFAPGAFDNFEGTQEELDNAVKEITETLQNMTPEELRANSRTVDLEEMFGEYPSSAKQLLQTLSNQNKRTLQ